MLIKQFLNPNKINVLYFENFGRFSEFTLILLKRYFLLFFQTNVFIGNHLEYKDKLSKKYFYFTKKKIYKEVNIYTNHLTFKSIF